MSLIFALTTLIIQVRPQAAHRAVLGIQVSLHLMTPSLSQSQMNPNLQKSRSPHLSLKLLSLLPIQNLSRPPRLLQSPSLLRSLQAQTVGHLQHPKLHRRPLVRTAATLSALKTQIVSLQTAQMGQVMGVMLL
ncbi:MAG: hypothetical protein H7318_19035 [Oligoflexus sp.]|nr:hypothetical protein [Oligoflexus sp.]